MLICMHQACVYLEGTKVYIDYMYMVIEYLEYAPVSK